MHMHKYADLHNSSSDLRIFLSAVFHIASLLCVPFLVKGTVNGNMYLCGVLLAVIVYYSVRLFRYKKLIGLVFFVVSLSGIVLGIYHFGLLPRYQNAKIYLEEEQKFCKENTNESLELKFGAEKSRIVASFRLCMEKEHVSPEFCNTKLNQEMGLNEVLLGNRVLRLSNCANSLITKQKNVDRIEKNKWVQFWMRLRKG
jgi:hypothetical protein